MTAIVDNPTLYNATISQCIYRYRSVVKIRIPYAGNDYTEANINIFGAGTGEELIADEFRDGAIP